MLNRSVVLSVVLLSTFSGAVCAQGFRDSLALVYENDSGQSIPYRIFLPPGHDEPGASFPLVLFLHGAGERGTNNVSQVASHIGGLIEATQGEDYPAFLVTPQVPSNEGWSDFGGDLAPAMQLTLVVIEQLELQYAIDASRRYVTGLSMGGFGTFDLVADRPDLFAAAAPLSGGGDASAVNPNIRTWISHGSTDSVVLPDASRVMVQSLHDAGAEPIYQEIVGGHAIWSDVYTDPAFYDWMFNGINPVLPELIYNSVSGNVTINTAGASGDQLWAFNLIFDAPLVSDPTLEAINGIEVSSRPRSGVLVYRSTEDNGFEGVVDFGHILPPGLNYFDVHSRLRTRYRATGTGNEDFHFAVRIVPEPSGSFALICIVASILAAQRRCDSSRSGLLK